jgi:hypothetical protein
MIMEKKNQKTTPPVERTQAPLDENPLAKPEKSKKDIAAKKRAKSETMKDDEWVI